MQLQVLARIEMWFITFVTCVDLEFGTGPLVLYALVAVFDVVYFGYRSWLWRSQNSTTRSHVSSELLWSRHKSLAKCGPNQKNTVSMPMHSQPQPTDLCEVSGATTI